MRRTKVAALIAAIALTAVGCTSAGEVVDSGNTAGGPPLPKGATEVSDLPAPDREDKCNAQASLRPDGPLPAPGDFPPGSAMATILARGKLVVGVDQNTYKFGYRDPDSGDLQGFDIDMAKEIAKAIFGDPNAIQFKVLTSADRIPAVTSGEVDIVVQTMTINCERREQVDFSSVYYMAGQKVLVKKDSKVKRLEDLGGKKVCAAKGSTSIANVVNAEVDPEPIGIAVAGWTDCLVMLQQNQVDAISTDDTILAGLKAQDPFTMIVGERFTDEPYGMAISKDSPELTRFVNAVLEQLRSGGRWAEIYNEWLRVLLDEPASPPPAKYRS
jgi:polar amino acid transport system substrate-binding protein